MITENDCINFSTLKEKVEKDPRYIISEKQYDLFTNQWITKYFCILYNNYFIIWYADNFINSILQLLNINNTTLKNYYDKLEKVILFIRNIQKNNKNITNFIFSKIIDKFLPSVSKQEFPLNRILYGAPGTGKSYQINKDIENYPNDKKKVFRITLHPEYSYYDFVRSIKPKINGEKISYEFVKGDFTKALIQAYKNENSPVFLILEEISRANVSAVFGDIFQLLDRKNGISEYKIKNDNILNAVLNECPNFSSTEIYIPKNLFIWGTLNTSDQNVFVMDNAFKRRFEFEYIPTIPPIKNDNNNNEYMNDYIFYYAKDKRISWCNFYQELNKYIIEELKLSEDKQLGQFFIKFTDDDKINNKQIINKLMNYLWNDIEKAVLINDSNKIFSENIKSFFDVINRCKSILNNEINDTEELFSQKFLDILEKKENE